MCRSLSAVLVASALLHAPAHAETLLTPFAGAAFGGATGKTRGSYGGSLAFLGQGTGFEVEFGITPHFFGESMPDEFFTRDDVVTLMGNLLLVVQSDAVTLYGVAGAGLLRSRLEDASELFDVSSTDFGFNAGGGLIAWFGRTVGLRADVRYFRSFSDLEANGGLDLDLGTVDYWRAVGGISLRF